MAASKRDTSYIDSKGRVRWHRNDAIAERINDLGNFLIIGGYDESHARRYPRLAHTISRYPESVVEMEREGRLQEIPGVGGTIAEIIREFLGTGTCGKMEDWARRVPKSVLELTKIPGLGAKTIRMLYRNHDIKSLGDLKKALEDGRLEGAQGIGKKTKETMRRFFAGSKR